MEEAVEEQEEQEQKEEEEEDEEEEDDDDDDDDDDTRSRRVCVSKMPSQQKAPACTTVKPLEQDSLAVHSGDQTTFDRQPFGPLREHRRGVHQPPVPGRRQLVWDEEGRCRVPDDHVAVRHG